MNAERLLAHYEKIADAPDAIARLRRFILDLAVRGKLVQQEGSWKVSKIEGCLEPLSDGRFIHQGWSPQCESHPSASKEIWGVLKTTAIQDGFFLKDQNKELPKKLEPKPILEIRAGDILITCAGPRARCGIACLVKETRARLMISGKMYRFRANEKVVTPEYLELFLRSEAAQGAIDSIKTGSSESGLNLTQDRFRTLEVRFGLLAEQHRIVAKVGELMRLCDRLEAVRASREEVRDRLAAASLARLNTPDPETFRADARFILTALPTLTTRPDQIKRLRQTILNLAVRGRLVPQDAKDEPASELLKRIAEEITVYGKANRIVQMRAEPIPDDDLQFTAPNGWEWTRLCTLFKIITDGDHQPPPKADKGVAFLTIGNVTTGRLDFAGCRLVPLSYFKSLAPYRTPASGDILYTVVGATYGRPALVETDRAFCVQRHIAILKPARAMSLRFILGLLASPLIYDQATRSTTGSAQPTIALRPLRNFLAPIPPLAEQHRIAAKVDEVMALCDRLESSLAATAATRRRLLDALLSQALAPSRDSANIATNDQTYGGANVRHETFAEKERSALILMLAYERHRSARREKTFGHVKAQKILHLVEAEANYDLGRAPVKDAAGPNDFQHMLAVEKWAQEHRRFTFEKNGSGYTFKKLPDFEKFLESVKEINAETLARVEKIIDLFIPMDTETAEVFATVYAAWNNYLIEEKKPSDDDIIRAARDEWHPQKLKIARNKFVATLHHLRRSGFVPSGRGKFVRHPQQQDIFFQTDAVRK